ncbi:nucleoside hydrolase [Niallia sp. 03133]|uniref:nucleoside hydrolase n=1 Tax=Niallia sp. 03133 TaxID=3458060 RepID=UPI004043CBF8
MVKIILDCDAGIDDAFAIAYAVHSPEIELLGVTVCFGNAQLHYTYRNAKKILSMLDCNIGVWKGTDKPLVLEREYNGVIHGKDGLGNTLGEVDKEDFEECQHAVDYIIEQAHKYKKDLTLVVTGPLTNLALAIQKDPEIVNLIGKVVTMGGALTTPGNVNKFAEANYRMDPHAAQYVFQTDLPIVMVGLDVTRKTLLTNEDVEDWRKKGTEVASFFADFTQYYLNVYKEIHPYLKGCALHDPLAIGVAKLPDLVQTIPIHIHVDTEEDAYGRTTEDLYRNSPEKPTTEVSIQVDAERFMEDFYKYVLK